jgi:soluble lytic murein transglycosylase
MSFAGQTPVSSYETQYGSGREPDLSNVLARVDSVTALEALLLVAGREGDLAAFRKHSGEKRRQSTLLAEDLLVLLDRQVPSLAEHGATLCPFLLKDGRPEHALRVFLPFVETVPDTTTGRGYFYLTAGLMLRMEGRHAQARLYFEAAAGVDFPLAAHAVYLAMESASASRELERMLMLLGELEASEPPGYLLTRARIVAGLALVGSRLEGEASSVLERVAEARLDRKESVQIAHALGGLYEKSEEFGKAAGSYARAFEKTTSHEEATEASRSYLRLVREKRVRGNETALLSAAKCLMRSGRGLEAQTALTDLFREGKGSLEAGWQLGRLYYRARRYRDATTVFGRLEKLEKRKRDSRRAGLWIARCKRQLYQTEEAIRRFREIALSGRYLICMEAAWELGMELESLGRLEQAVESYDSLQRRFPGTKLGREGLWRRGLCEYKLDRLAEARSTFASLAEGRVPSSVHDTATFWMLKCSFEAGDSLSAEELLRTKARGSTLYGLLLERISTSGVLDEVLFDAPWPDANWIAAAKHERFPRTAWPREEAEGAQEEAGESSLEELGDGLPSEISTAVSLLRFGLRDLAKEELRIARRESSGESRDLFFLAQLYWQNEFHKEALSLADRLLKTGRGLSRDEKRFLKRMLYPVYRVEVVLEESRSQDVNPFLVLSVMRRESTFDPEATSPAGATGLMQLMPGTAGEIAAYLGEEDPVGELKDPELNTRYGVWLLGRLKGKYSGSVVAALAAYNAGEYNADRWLAAAGDSDGFVFMESITFRETREYLRRVLSDLHVYTSLYVR